VALEFIEASVIVDGEADEVTQTTQKEPKAKA
jgi:hypothetical protein